MSKLLLPLAGLGSATAAGVGGYMLAKGNNESTEKTFRSEYSLAVLGDTNSLWDSKFEALKNSNQSTPIQPELISAKAKFAVQTSHEEAKRLQKEGCRKIYDSKIEGTAYLQDFQKYCSKTIKDGISEAWITQEKSDSQKWDPKLTKLKTHNDSENGELDATLKNLKSQLSGGTNNNWNDDKREVLKGWCDGVKGEIFIGDKDPKFIHAKLYCDGS
ncbi:hypothetical protein MHF_0860 [Mycoplasma haemofelis Ohio2]|uniref:Lipoprotein n=1 Tax=Mycoplasma haemofelis (strain Ohio2) TaxID=859194 RepID=F6FIS6_MYCHI|nr:hypothetical protein MHF_0860 [Mycoplasma haemofelis Ohio2]